MAEYIERERIRKTSVGACLENQHIPMLLAATIDQAIDCEPAADVAPVVHGKWLNFYNDFSCAECDRCGTIFEVTDNETDEGLWNAFLSAYRYCPNCGAKMDEEEHNNV